MQSLDFITVEILIDNKVFKCQMFFLFAQKYTDLWCKTSVNVIILCWTVQDAKHRAILCWTVNSIKHRAILCWTVYSTNIGPLCCKTCISVCRTVQDKKTHGHSLKLSKVDTLRTTLKSNLFFYRQ